jgi:hypothetical protein
MIGTYSCICMYTIRNNKSTYYLLPIPTSGDWSPKVDLYGPSKSTLLSDIPLSNVLGHRKAIVMLISTGIVTSVPPKVNFILCNYIGNQFV